MTDHLKFIPGPEWPKTTAGCKIVMPDGAELPRVRHATINLPAQERPTIEILADIDFDELEFPEAQTVITPANLGSMRVHLDGSARPDTHDHIKPSLWSRIKRRVKWH